MLGAHLAAVLVARNAVADMLTDSGDPSPSDDLTGRLANLAQQVAGWCTHGSMAFPNVLVVLGADQNQSVWSILVLDGLQSEYMDRLRDVDVSAATGFITRGGGAVTLFLWCGALGSWLFVATFVLDGWTRAGYQPVRHPVSALALGARGWLQATNFILCGLAITVGAVALASALGSVVLAVVVAVFGVSLVASGVFPMDAMRGYPPGTPDETPSETSLRHKLHDWAGVVVFGSLPIAAIVAIFVLPETSWKWYSALTAAATLVGFVAFGQAWEQDHPRAGLVQRATIIVGWIWLGAVFAYAAV